MISDQISGLLLLLITQVPLNHSILTELGGPAYDREHLCLGKTATESGEIVPNLHSKPVVGIVNF